MSEAPQIPRLLAALLGVEPPPPSGPPRSVAPPADAPAPAARGGSVPVGTRGRERRRTPEGARGTVVTEELTGASSAEPASGRSSVGRPPARPAPGDVRGSVRRTLASREALRTGVVVAEVLGRPRAMRPYGTDVAL